MNQFGAVRSIRLTYSIILSIVFFMKVLVILQFGGYHRLISSVVSYAANGIEK